MAYATVEEVKAFAKISYEDLGYSTEEEFNGFISSLINYASALVEDYCNQSWDTPPNAVKFVVIQICANTLHEILQRKINPIIQQSEFQLRLLVPNAFTDELKRLLDVYKSFEIYREGESTT